MQSNPGAESTNKPNADAQRQEGVLNIPSPQEANTTPDTQAPPTQIPQPEQIPEQVPEQAPSGKPGVVVLTKEKMAQMQEADKAHAAELAAREDRLGNPEARVADPAFVHVQPRYDIVQNRSNMVLVVPDLKTNVEDRGLVLQPGEVAVLHDFYSPQEINRSRGLRFAATEMKGIGGNMALVPLKSEEEGANFKAPERKTYPPGTTFEDPDENNPFDEAFVKLEEREAKREEKLLRKTLAARKQRSHGKVTHV